MSASALLLGLFSTALLATPVLAALTGRLGPPDEAAQRMIFALLHATLKLARCALFPLAAFIIAASVLSCAYAFFEEGAPAVAFIAAPLVGGALALAASYFSLTRLAVAAGQEVSQTREYDRIAFRYRSAAIGVLPTLGAMGLACLGCLSAAPQYGEQILFALLIGGLGTLSILARYLVVVRGGIFRDLPARLTDPTQLTRIAVDFGFEAIFRSALLFAALGISFLLALRFQAPSLRTTLLLLVASGALAAFLGSFMMSKARSHDATFAQTTALLSVLAMAAGYRLSANPELQVLVLGSMAAVSAAVLLLVWPSRTGQRKLAVRLELVLLPLLSLVVILPLLASESLAAAFFKSAGAILGASALFYLPWALSARGALVLEAAHPGLMSMAVRGQAHSRPVASSRAIASLPVFLLLSLILLSEPLLAAHFRERAPEALLVLLLTGSWLFLATRDALRLYLQQQGLLETTTRLSLNYQTQAEAQGSLLPEYSAPLAQSVSSLRGRNLRILVLLFTPPLCLGLAQAFERPELIASLSASAFLTGTLCLLLAWLFSWMPWKARFGTQHLPLLGLYFLSWGPLLTGSL